MSGSRKFPGGFVGNKVQNSLDHMLDFGPEKPEAKPVASTSSNSGIQRLQQIVKKLQEINKRIDELASRF